MNLLRTQKHKRRHPVGSEYSARHVFNERTKKGLRLFDVSPLLLSGEGEIRTPGRFDPTPVFKTGAFDHSATSPKHRRDNPIGLVTPQRRLSEHARVVAVACQ